MTLDARLAELTALRAARKDDLDLPRSMTQREVNTYLAETAALDTQIHALRTAASTLAELTPALAADTQWLADQTAWRATLCDELLEIKSPIRDRAVKEKADDLIFSIRLIDFGTSVSTLGPIITLAPTRIGQLMAAASYATTAPALTGPHGWRGSMKEVERRIAAMTKQQTTAKAQLDSLLLTDDERTQREAEHAAHRAVLNSMQIRNDADGTGLVAYTPDGHPLDPAAMTPEQRAALAWQQSIS